MTKATTIKVGSDFSGVGAFDQALRRLKIDYKTVFSCDMDKYARQSYIENYGEPEYYPTNVYERSIPQESLDLYMTSPPCQSFSLAGKRKGKDSTNGVLFFNSHEFIKVNKPRFFIFENVKGLLSDDGGKTFSEWVNMLGGKTVNGLPVLFPYNESVPYHIYYKVLNSKKHGVPQNRERVFIVGIRDDKDNNFTFPKEEPLTKKLKDVLEDEVSEKYYLSSKMVNSFTEKTIKQKALGNGFCFKPTEGNEASKAITCKAGNRIDDQYILVSKEVRTEEAKAQRKESGTNDFRGKKLEFRKQDCSNAITTGLTKDHFIADYRKDEGLRIRKDNCSPTLAARARNDVSGMPILKNNNKIRRLTPRECFRLQDFSEDYKIVVSDTQAYKQAGNSITVGVLAKIIDKLKL